MPTFVLTCESCGGRRPFLIDEWALPDLEKGSRVEKHCPSCHGMTNWTLAMQDRRTGRERRQGDDRRTPER